MCSSDLFADVLVGSEDAGEAYVYLGAAVLHDAPATTLVGTAAERFGAALAGAGDLDGDGYMDVVVGAPDAEGDGWAGVYRGGPDGVETTPWLEVAETDSGDFGDTVWGPDDLDGDGLDDLLVGAPDDAFHGHAYVYAGSDEAPSADPAVTLSGGVFGGRFGDSVASGDLDGDGRADVVVGEPGAEQAVAWLGADGLAEGTTTQEGVPWGDYLGGEVAAGDFDGDGRPDVALGLPTSAYSNSDGRVAVYLSESDGPATEAAVVLDGRPNEMFGEPVAAAQDVDGDGDDELLVGIYEGFYLFPGSPDGPGDDEGVRTGDAFASFGSALDGAGDVDGDGFGDVAIGSWGAPDWRYAFVYQGAATGLGLGTILSDDALWFGNYVGAAGDVNADGYADLVVGARSQDGVGTAMVYAGAPTGRGGGRRRLDRPGLRRGGHSGRDDGSCPSRAGRRLRVRGAGPVRGLAPRARTARGASGAPGPRSGLRLPSLHSTPWGWLTGWRGRSCWQRTWR